MYNKTLKNNFLTLCIDITIVSERFELVMKSERENNCIFLFSGTIGAEGTCFYVSSIHFFNTGDDAAAHMLNVYNLH